MGTDLITVAKRLVPTSVKRAARRGVGRDSTSDEDPTSHRTRVGGLWESIGKLQFEFLVDQGLEPHHRLLDIGCGSLRGGVNFARHLQPNHYFGVDADASLIAAGRRELRGAGIPPDTVALRHTADFDVDFGVKFDFALAQSVFTHLPLNSIQMCLLRVAPVLAPEGRFYATFFHSRLGKNHTDPIKWEGTDRTVTTYVDRDPYHYDLSAFQWICDGIDLEVRHIGEWDHPRRQEMLMFQRPKVSTS